MTMFSCVNHEVIFEDVEKEQVCTLSSEILIDYPYCMEILNNDLFAVSTFESVYLIDREGNLVRGIGRTGRAAGEYSFPMKVRRGETGELFVWSANTLRFLLYDYEGNYIQDFPYDSGISDFMYHGGKLYIYTGGSAAENMINAYDLSTGKIDMLDSEVSEYHKLLTSTVSAAPIFMSEEKLYYSPKDLTEIRCMGEGRVAVSLKSETFSVDKTTDPAAMIDDREKKQLFFANSSYTAGLIKKGECWYLLAYEGKSQIEGRHLNNSARQVVLYSSMNGPRCFHASDFGSLATLSSYDGSFYFLSHNIEDDEDVYVLEAMVL